jgi:hypothetical protein
MQLVTSFVITLYHSVIYLLIDNFSIQAKIFPEKAGVMNNSQELNFYILLCYEQN